MDFEMPGLQTEHVSGVRDEAFSARFSAENASSSRFVQDSTATKLGEVAAQVALKRYEPSLKEKLSHDQESRIPHLNLLDLVHIDETSQNERGDQDNSITHGHGCETSSDKGIPLPENLCINKSFHGLNSLFAKHPFKRGEIVLVEEPLAACMAEPGSKRFALFDDKSMQKLLHELETIAGDAKRSLESLCEAYFPDVCTPNSYVKLCIPIENRDKTIGTAVFAVASRISHSCSPNVEQHWDDSTSCARFVATRDIEEGEELTLAYADVLSDSATRGKRIKELFGFQCLCPTCSASGSSLRLSDLRRERIRVLDEKISKAILLEKFEYAVKFVRERIKLLQAEGLDSAKNLLRCEYDGFRASLELGKLKESERFFKLACKHSDEAYGANSAESCNLQLQAQDLEFQRAMFEAIYE